MILAEFNALPYDRQRAAVFENGTFLASRLVHPRVAVNLHHLPGGLFVAVYYDLHANQITQLRAFPGTMPPEQCPGGAP